MSQIFGYLRVFSRSHRLPPTFAILLLTLALSLTLPQAARAAGWTTTGPLATARQEHTATLLPNGKILVVGGYNGSYQTSCELYDPATGTRTSTGSLTTRRSYHTATLLPNGKVLVVGGYNGSYLNSAEIYDPAANGGMGAWTATPTPGTSRAYHTATLLPNGKVLVAGGFNGSNLASAQLYNPATNTWAATGPLGNARRAHTANLLSNGKVLVASGHVGGTTTLLSAEIFDPAGNGGVGAWTFTGNLNVSTYWHTATLLPNGKVLVAGGINPATGYKTRAELFDPTTGIWTLTGSLSTTPRWIHTATLLPNGKVLVAAGHDGTNRLSSAELYDTDSGAWAATGPLATARDLHTATLLPNGQVLAVGGRSASSTYLASVEIYEYATGSWASGLDLNAPRTWHTATLMSDSQVLVAGGTVYSTPSDTMALYNSASNSWSYPGITLKEARLNHTATLLPNGKVLVAGGQTLGTPKNTAELYDGAWNYTFNNLSAARYDHTATLLADGKVLVAGGVGAGNNPLPSAEIFNPAANSGAGEWTPTGNLATERTQHTATLLPNGKVLVTGGGSNGPHIASAEIYNPSTGLWGATTSLPTPRIQHTATLLPSGKVLVAGGAYWDGAVFQYPSSTLLYDPVAQTWTAAGNLNTARVLHKAILLPNGKVLVAGGNDSSSKRAGAELFDPATGVWTDVTGTSPNHFIGRYGHTATLLPNGKVLVVAGYGPIGSFWDVRRFDAALGFSSDWVPLITAGSITPVISLGNYLRFAGAGFLGKSEASGGATNNSSTGYPLVQMRSIESGWMHWLPPSSGSFSDTYFTSTPIWEFLPSGHYLVTVFTNGIPSISDFTNFVNTNPTAIKLISFEAEPSLNKIVLTWETATETNNAGFHLWRAAAGTENYVQITDRLIPGEGTDTKGAFYEYTDADVTPGQSYSYKLQDVDLDGKTSFHGPVTATAGFLTLQAPNDGEDFSPGEKPQFRWQSYPFDKFRLQFCKLEDFSGQVVELPLAKKGKTIWITGDSYTPTDKEWSAVKALVGRKGGWLCWRVMGAYGAQGSAASEPWRFKVLAR